MNGICCTSRLGIVKAFYASRDDALDAAQAARSERGVNLEPYPCAVQAGRWHLRTIRPNPAAAERTAA